MNQGGASGSTGIQLGGRQMRMAAAEARRVLVDMAAEEARHCGRRAEAVDGVSCTRRPTPGKPVSYKELIGGRYFNVPLSGTRSTATRSTRPGKAKPKDPKDHKIVGKSIPRDDMAPIVLAQTDYVTDIKRPNMLHARMIRPEVAGAVPVKVDEASIRDIPGAKVVWDKGFLAVVADKEWDAIKASEKLKVEWSDVKPPFVQPRTRFTTTSAKRPSASVRWKARPPATWTTPSRPPRA